MGKMRHGVHPTLEREANRLLRESMRGVTSHTAKSDVLTPWKEQDRRRREVYVETGTPDESIRRGMYHRPINQRTPHLNSVEGIAPPPRYLRPGGKSYDAGFESLAKFVEDNSG